MSEIVHGNENFHGTLKSMVHADYFTNSYIPTMVYTDRFYYFFLYIMGVWYAFNAGSC
ncbi:MAG: hypothetical protein UW44_C0008G0122 [Candidatus Collierbacteria bacterium GW2011_GWB2_44_22]|uniref:Uncharacterized protein n=1 Tax=Candidatus Collierbacteria bacterium GW2011_GWB2_44_22 TaxID=1618387 RepID=A0A0G1HXY2_9BACT|nr:MAG: hypothetical protein UW44_C0008G0122 [Candidatus Collierbacteria bacterium GW2011_GWB2_44_22]